MIDVVVTGVVVTGVVVTGELDVTVDPTDSEDGELGAELGGVELGGGVVVELGGVEVDVATVGVMNPKSNVESRSPSFVKSPDVADPVDESVAGVPAPV